MSAAKWDILVEQGTTFSRILTIKSKIDGEWTPVDISSWVFKGQIRKRTDSDDTEADFSFEKLNQSTNTGQVVVTIEADETRAIDVDRSDRESPDKVLTRYVFDIEATIDGGEVDRVVEGIATISPEVTK